MQTTQDIKFKNFPFISSFSSIFSETKPTKIIKITRNLTTDARCREDELIVDEAVRYCRSNRRKGTKQSNQTRGFDPEGRSLTIADL